MAKKLYEEENIRAIATKVRELTGSENTYTTAEMPGGVDEVYGAGVAEGSEQMNRMLSGVYILKEEFDINSLAERYPGFAENFSKKGVYAHFWTDDDGGDTNLLELDKMDIAFVDDYYLNTLTLYAEEGENRSTSFYHDNTIEGGPGKGWTAELAYWEYDGDNGYWQGYNGDVLPAQGRCIVFTQPTIVSQQTYDLFMEITDNRQDIVESAVTVAKDNAALAERTRFWNGISGTDFMYAFASPVWNDTTFGPTKDLYVYKAKNMFGRTEISTPYSSKIQYLDTALGNYKIRIYDEEPEYMFEYASNTIRIGGLVWAKCPKSLFYTFTTCSRLQTIVEPIPVASTTSLNNTFYNCSALVDVRFTGVIGFNGFRVSWCTKLSHDSLLNIIECLEDKSGDTSGTVWTLYIGSANLAKLTEEELDIAYQKGWMVE